MSAGRIPDPEHEWNRSLSTLIPHHEALVATEKFLQYSDQKDKEDSIYQFNPVNSLISLLPDRIRMSKDNTLFRANDCTSRSAKERYRAFSNWLKEFHTSLQDWDVEAQVSTTVHQTLIGTSANPESTVLITTNQGSTAETGTAKHAPDIGTQHTDTPQLTAPA